MTASQHPSRPAVFVQSEIGPVEIEEPNGIFWNRLDWPSYLKCPFNADLSSLIRIVQDGWRVESPQIIVAILADSQALSRWQNLEQIRRFQQGLVKAASSARTWIITNGLNVGAARITSEAIANERNWQHSLRSPEAQYDAAIFEHPHASNSLPIMNSVIIGVIGSDQIKNRGPTTFYKHARQVGLG